MSKQTLRIATLALRYNFSSSTATYATSNQHPHNINNSSTKPNPNQKSNHLYTYRYGYRTRTQPPEKRGAQAQAQSIVRRTQKGKGNRDPTNRETAARTLRPNAFRVECENVGRGRSCLPPARPSRFNAVVCVFLPLHVCVRIWSPFPWNTSLDKLSIFSALPQVDLAAVVVVVIALARYFSEKLKFLTTDWCKNGVCVAAGAQQFDKQVVFRPIRRLSFTFAIVPSDC